MFEAVLVLKWNIFEKTRFGLVPTDNEIDQQVKTITAISRDECENKVREFLSEVQFIPLKEPTNGTSSCNKK